MPNFPSMRVPDGARGSAFSSLPSDSPLEAAFLIRRTGAVVASWARPDLEADVVGVMAATMLASIDTLGGALGCPPSGRVAVETDRCRLLATRVEPNLLLVVLAPRTLDPGGLRREAGRILERLRTPRRGDAAPFAASASARAGPDPFPVSRPRPREES